MTKCLSIALSCVLFLLATSSVASAQIDDEGTWLALFGQGKIRDIGYNDHQLKWWFDGHARFLNDADGFTQSIVRPGVGYTLGDYWLADNLTLWAGYGWIRTEPITGAGFDEDRVWQQLTWSKQCEPFKFGFRSRLEQRFIETGDDTGWRFRQLVRAQHNLPNYPRLALVTWDELFIHLNDTDWGANAGFNQNRAFVGLGLRRHPESAGRVEFGYLNQAIHNPTGNDRSHHLLSINFYYTPQPAAGRASLRSERQWYVE